jgi:DNA-binding SARP family transcriptional activator/TolB-like protein/Flp pilus assembly protein TadD
MASFTLLGRIRLEEREGTEVDALLRQPKRIALLAYLASPHPGSWHRRDILLSVFWPELDAGRGRAALRNALYVLRQHLGEGALRTRGDEEVSLDPAQFTTDVAQLETDLAEKRFRAALQAYRGDFLPGLFVPDAEEFEKWLDQERSRIRGLARRAAGALADELERVGNLSGAVEAATRASELDPDSEPALRRLMELLDRTGAAAQALAAYERFRNRMATEFSAEPSAATTELAHRVRSRRITPSPVPAPPLSTPAIEEPLVGAVDPEPPSPYPRRGRRKVLLPIGMLFLAALLVVALRAFRASPGAPPARSLVVLPMQNVTGDPQLAYLATGIAEDLASRLRGLGGLAIIHSAARAEWPRETAQDISLIGHEFGSEMGLRSRLLRADDSLEVSAELVDLKSGDVRRLGGLRFVPGTVVDLESRLAALVAGAAFRRPVPTDPRSPPHPVNQESYRLNLLGWHQLLTVRDIEAAKKLFTEATRIDPQNPRAWAGLSSVWATQAVTWGVPFEQGYSFAEAAATRALAVDSLQGSAWANLGILRGLRDRSLAAGEKLLDRAIRVEPGNPEIFLIQAALYRHAWQWDKARDAIRIARQLDPLSAVYVTREATLPLCSDQAQAAVGLYREALRLDPSSPAARDGMARALARLHRWDEAIDQLRDDSLAARDPAFGETIRSARGEAGYWKVREALARPRLQRQVAERARGWVSTAQLGTLYIAAGDTAHGLDLLESESAREDVGLLRLPCQPDVDRVRGSPRFERLLQRIARTLPR